MSNSESIEMVLEQTDEIEAPKKPPEGAKELKAIVGKFEKLFEEIKNLENSLSSDESISLAICESTSLKTGELTVQVQGLEAETEGLKKDLEDGDSSSEKQPEVSVLELVSQARDFCAIAQEEIRTLLEKCEFLKKDLMTKKVFVNLKLSDQEEVCISGTQEEVRTKEEFIREVFAMRSNVMGVLERMEYILAQRTEEYDGDTGVYAELYDEARTLFEKRMRGKQNLEETLKDFRSQKRKIYGKEQTLPRIKEWIMDIVGFEKKFISLKREIKKDILNSWENFNAGVVKNSGGASNAGKRQGPSPIEPSSRSRFGGGGYRGHGHH